MLGLGKEILRYGRRGDSKTHISLLIQIFEKKRYNPWAQLQAAKIFQIHQKFPFLNRTTTKFLWTQKSFGKIFRLFSVSKEFFWECSVHFFRGPWPRQVTYIAQKMMFFAPRSSPISPVSPLGGARLLQLRLHCLGCWPGSFLHSLVNWNNSSYSFDSGSHLACYEYQLK